MPDQLADFRYHIIHRLERFAAIDFPLEPMPKPFDWIVLWAIRREMFQCQPRCFGEKSLHFFARVDAAIIQNQHQDLLWKTLRQLMEKGNEG